MWILQLNDMRDENPSVLKPVARAETKEELEEFVNREMVEPYQDGGHGKCFKEGGLLEWCNPPVEQISQPYINVQDEETWAERARVDFRERVLSIPEIPG